MLDFYRSMSLPLSCLRLSFFVLHQPHIRGAQRTCSWPNISHRLTDARYKPWGFHALEIPDFQVFGRLCFRQLGFPGGGFPGVGFPGGGFPGGGFPGGGFPGGGAACPCGARCAPPPVETPAFPPYAPVPPPCPLSRKNSPRTEARTLTFKPSKTARARGGYGRFHLHHFRAAGSGRRHWLP